MASGQYWAAAQVMPGREHLIRAEIEKRGIGAFLSTFAKVWVSEGRVSASERPLVPGYVFFRTTPEGWGSVASTDGVQRVLADGAIAKAVAPADMVRLVVSHATGAFNQVTASLSSRREKKNSRKSRPGKRIRKARSKGFPQ